MINGPLLTWIDGDDRCAVLERERKREDSFFPKKKRAVESRYPVSFLFISFPFCQ